MEPAITRFGMPGTDEACCAPSTGRRKSNENMRHRRRTLYMCVPRCPGYLSARDTMRGAEIGPNMQEMTG
eukprot:505951-Rhodomonas_salina.2